MDNLTMTKKKVVNNNSQHQKIEHVEETCAMCHKTFISKNNNTTCVTCTNFIKEGLI
jgi:hypothetical protein